MRSTQWSTVAVFLSVSLFLVSTASGDAVPNATTVLSAVDLKPTLRFQEDAAGPRGTYTSTIIDEDTTATGVFVSAATAIAKVPVSLSYTIPLSETNIYGLCWYPVSGYYGQLSRVLFYATMLFALFARRHQWLIIGALAASMTYAGTAAIHACVMVWGNSGLGNNDIYAVLGILLFSSAMIIPLLTWSTTVKDLGKRHEEESIGRSIIIVWGLLVFLGFATIFIGIILGLIYPERFHVYSPALTASENFTCTPSENTLDLTAGQQETWTFLYTTQEFIETNHCTNPCGKLGFDTLLKPAENLKSLAMTEVEHWEEIDTTKKKGKVTEFLVLAFAFAGAIILWSMFQALTVMMFGRRTPTQVRNKAYLMFRSLFMDHNGTPTDDTNEKHKIPNFFAKAIAYSLYAWGVITTICSAIIIIGSIIATEFMMAGLPQSDENYEVDQWASWVATGLVLITAFLYRFEGIFEDCINRFINFTMQGIHRAFHGPCKQDTCGWPSKQCNQSDISNVNVIQIAFGNSYKHYKDRFTSWPKTWQGSWQDSKNFYSKPVETAKQNKGGGHQRDRKVVNTEGQRFPDEWEADKVDDWLRIDEFVDACRRYDRMHREKSGKGYKWQPRVIPDDGMTDGIRTSIDRALFKDIFRIHKSKASGHDDEKALHMQDTAYDPAAYGLEGEHAKASLMVTTTPLDSSSTPSIVRSKNHMTQHISELNESNMHPIHRTYTAPISQYSAARHSRQMGSGEHASAPAHLRHAATFQERPKRVPVGRVSSSSALSSNIGATSRQTQKGSHLSQFDPGATAKPKPPRVVSMDKHLPELPAQASESWVDFAEEDSFLEPIRDYRDSRAPNVSPMTGRSVSDES